MRRLLSFAALSILTLSASASAQRSGTGVNPSPELGIDAGITSTLDDPKVTVVAIPFQYLRAGFFLSPAISLEPSLSLMSISVPGGSGTSYALGLGMLYHFSTSRAASQMYVRPFIALDGTSGGGQSSSGFTLGGGFGVKLPINPRFATRFEGNIGHRSESGLSQNSIGLLAGLSVYTR
jgi:hypothetical protein